MVPICGLSCLYEPPLCSRDAGKSGNCKAGFVADKGISSAFVRDFYLQSHGGLLGSESAAKYLDGPISYTVFVQPADLDIILC